MGTVTGISQTMRSVEHVVHMKEREIQTGFQAEDMKEGDHLEALGER
jgi:hypothetical protein